MEESEGEEDECMQLDSTTIATSALPSLLALKHWGKEVCIECLLSSGLLPGDSVFNRVSGTVSRYSIFIFVCTLEMPF